MELNTTPPTGEMPMVGRPILDANIGMTNRIEHDDICDIMVNTFSDIAEVLSDHCGPYGQFAMITTPNNRVAEPVFTKDGINIVRAMEYMSPMEEFARTTLAYIGSRIETAAGDGTTSSMMICATGLSNLLRYLKNTEYTYSYNEMINTYKDFADEVIELLDHYKYTLDKYSTPENRKDVIRRIAFHQAYTSSHGNRELSFAVADLFANTPEEAWNYMYIDKCKYETDKTYQVDYDDTQYTIQNVRSWPVGALTDELGTKRVRKDAHVLISGVPPANGFLEGQELLKSVKYAIENNEDLTVVCPNSMDTATMNELSTLFDQNPNHNVAFFFTNDNDPRLNDIVCIKALCNQFDVVSDLEHIDYVYENGDFKILKGLYEPSENKLNPMVGNPEYKHLNLLLEQLDKIISQIKSEVSNRSNNTEVARLQKFRMKLMVSKRAYFLIGGSAYDNAAAVDVVVDAILAVKHTLDKGFTLGGNITLHRALETMATRYSGVYATPASQKRAALMRAYAELFKRGIEYVRQSNLKWFHDLPNHIRLVIDYENSLDITAIDAKRIPKNTNRDRINSCMISVEEAVMGLRKDDAMCKDNGPALIIQPATADMELIKRFGELALKFVRTQRIITPGGVCTLPKKEESTEQNP